MIEPSNWIETKEMPLYNEIGFFPADKYTTTQPYNYAEMVKLIRKTPEAVGILRAIQTDICSDGYTFAGDKGKVKKAMDFARKNRFKFEFSACVFDWLLFGNGALWKSKLNKSDIKQVLEKVSLLTGIETKEADLTELNTETDKTRMLKCAPWSTMNIEMNDKKTYITGYHQQVDGEDIASFKTNELIHFKFMQFDGRVYGFSPVEAAINVMTTLSLIKDVNGSFFQNGGVPDWMFILSKEHAGSSQVKKLEQTLKKYKASRGKHGNLVFTGDVNPIQMNKIGDKDMDFKGLAIYYTGIFALAIGMPMARIEAIIGSEVKGGTASTDLSEAGYWRSISSYQDDLEEQQNLELWEPEFGVQIKFNRGYLNDQIKEAQRDVQMFEVLNNLMKAKAIKPEYIKEVLKIPDRHWTGKFEVVEKESSFGGGFGSPGSTPKAQEKGTAGQAKIAQKKTEATAAMERKETDSIQVDLPEFVGIFNKWIKTTESRDLDYNIKGDNYNFYATIPDGRYCLEIGKSQISEVTLNELLSSARRVKNA